MKDGAVRRSACFHFSMFWCPDLVTVTLFSRMILQVSWRSQRTKTFMYSAKVFKIVIEKVLPAKSFFSPLFWNLAQLGAKSRQVFWPTWWLLALSSIPVATPMSPTSPTSTSLRRCGPWRRRCGRWRCGFWSWWRRPKSLPTMSVPQLQAVADDGDH